MHERAISIALVTSFTARGIADALQQECARNDIRARMYVSGYQQYAQEILNSESSLYASQPRLVLLFLDARTLLGDLYLSPYSCTDEDRRRWVQERIREYETLVRALQQHSDATVVLHTLEVPTHSPLGILESKQSFGLHEAVESLNSALRNAYKNDARVFVFDYNAWCSNVGKRNAFDYKMYYLGDIKVHLRHIPDLCRAYMGYVKPILGMTKKCIVVDLDHTLWGGVLGEDGIEGIHLGPTPEGRSFWDFQKSLLSLTQRGVILAINSKNNNQDVQRVFREHPFMVLKEDHFVAMRINWNDKVSNMKALAEEMNIGLDSFVFFDDDPVNRSMVREFLPEVHVVDLPADPSLYVQTLHDIDVFHTLHLTDEDRERTALYAAERQRKTAAAEATDLTQYLRGLETVVTIAGATSQTIPRLAQLTQKTNQFNMTTRRYTEDEIRRFAMSDASMVLSVHVKDRFGDAGIVGEAIVVKEVDRWCIDVFLLSCRVIGRGVEQTLLATIIERACAAGVATVVGEFISTAKNAPARGFYEASGFVLQQSDGDREMWVRACTQNYPYPDFITVVHQ